MPGGAWGCLGVPRDAEGCLGVHVGVFECRVGGCKYCAWGQACMYV